MTADNPLKSEKAKVFVSLSPEQVCEQHNAILDGQQPTSKGDYIKRHDVRWEVRDGKPVIDWAVRPHLSGHHLKHPMDRRGEAMSAEDTNILNYCLEKAGATARYMPDGSRYTVERQAA